MGPQERRLLSELAVYLVRSCSRALQDLPSGETLAVADRRRWFAQAYREWQLTPRVDLAGRAPYEVIAAERAAATDQPVKASVEMYTDLPSFDPISPFPLNRRAANNLPTDPSAAPAADSNRATEPEPNASEWDQFANRLFGTWLDDELNRL